MIRITKKLDFRRGQRLRCVKKLEISPKFVFFRLLWSKYLRVKLKILNFQNRFDTLLEKRLSGVAEQEYARLYGLI